MQWMKINKESEPTNANAQDDEEMPVGEENSLPLNNKNWTEIM